MRKRILYPLFVWALTISPAAYAESPTEILNKLHATNQLEIHMGNMAQEKATSDEMRQYGKMLVSDHEDNDKQVKALATKLGIQLEDGKPGMMADMKMKSLMSERGTAFERKFAESMVEDHKKNIAQLQDAQKANLPQEVKNHIIKTLPALQKHLEKAQEIHTRPS